MKFFLIKLITAYQATLSPDHGLFRARFPHGYCKFYPTCSEYAKQAIIKHGVIKGSALGVARVIRCNPFAQPQVDMPN